MSQHQTRPERDLYDHEDEQIGPSGRRRGPVADWGVGEELFDQMPRRRFNRGEERGRPVRERRAGEPPERGEVPRGRVDDGRRTLHIGRDEDVPSDIAAVTADRDLDGVDEPAAHVENGHDAGPGATREAAAPEPADDGLDSATAAARSAPRDPSRRTVKIEGRPE